MKKLLFLLLLVGCEHAQTHYCTTIRYMEGTEPLPINYVVTAREAREMNNKVDTLTLLNGVRVIYKTTCYSF